VVSDGAAVICRVRLQDMARERIRAAVALGIAWGLTDAEIGKAVERELVASKVQPLTGEELLEAMKKPAHESSHRDSQGIQDLSRKDRPGFS